MAFTGTPVIKQVSDGLVRLHVNPSEESSFRLLPASSGTIGLFENSGSPDVRLPEGFKPREYTRQDDPVSLQDAVEVEYTFNNPGEVQTPVSVVKTGTTPADFLITIGNTSDDEEGSDTGDLEIYIRHH